MASRKTRARRNKRSHKRSYKRSYSRRHRMRGGVSPINHNGMGMGQRDSYAQGSQYLSMHKGQYGGTAPFPNAVMSSTLPSSMVPSARTGPLDEANASIQGMQDGGRRRKSLGRKHKQKGSRRHRGGRVLMGSPLSGSSMLLPSGMEKSAALSHEWSLAKDPNAFAPK